MAFTKHNSNGKRVLKLTLGAFGSLLALTPSVNAASITPNSSAIYNRIPLGHAPDDRPTLVAQTESDCPPNSGGSQFVTAETRSFYIYICGGDLPNTYVGVAKNRRTGGIILPLQSSNNDRFVAVNRNVRYTLTRNELIVTQNGRVILRERATWKW
jgi:hypothetical protein